MVPESAPSATAGCARQASPLLPRTERQPARGGFLYISAN